MDEPQLPSVDLVVATVDRVNELRQLFDSLETQTHRRFRVLLVDQNEDERLAGLLEHRRSFDVIGLRATRGLSHARNAALDSIAAELVAFPDDDCTLPPDLLERVARRFEADPRLDGLTGRAVDSSGRSATSWEHDAAVLSRANHWNRAISYTLFLRADLVRKLGPFDEQLGLGSVMPWSSGEETDYVVRAIDAGARIEYDPTIVVAHERKSLVATELAAVGSREGASVGYILRKHRYPMRAVARMLLRPAAGALVATLRGDSSRARFHLATLRGRALGYRSAP